MAVYLFIIIVCFLKMVIDNNTEWKNNRKIFVFLFLYMILLCGLRSYSIEHHVGIDTPVYYALHKDNISNSIVNIYNVEMNDKGFAILEIFLDRIGLNFTGCLVVYSAIYIISTGIFIYKYSSNPLMSIVVFVGLGLYIFAFSTIRQSIAMGICLLAFMLDDKLKGKKGFLYFLALVWIAQTIHASAIVFFPAYILKRLPVRKNIMFSMFIIAACTLFFKNQFSQVILKLAANTSDKYSAYQSLGETSAGMKLYILIFAIVVLRILLDKKMFKENSDDKTIYMLLFMLIIFPAVQGGGAIMRIYYYYYIFAVIFIPNTFNAFKSLKEQRIIYSVFSLFIIYFFITTVLKTADIVPYSFFGN